MNLYLKKKKILILAPFTASYSVKLLWFDELSLAPPAGEMKYFPGLPLLGWEPLGLLCDLAACCRPSVRPSSQHFLCQHFLWAFQGGKNSWDDGKRICWAWRNVFCLACFGIHHRSLRVSSDAHLLITSFFKMVGCHMTCGWEDKDKQQHSWRASVVSGVHHTFSISTPPICKVTQIHLLLLC